MIWTLTALTLLVAIWVFPHVWVFFVRNQIALDVRFEPRYVAIGDIVEIYCTLKNKSSLPCPFVQIMIQLPEGLSLSLHRTDRSICFSTHLARRQEMKVTLSCYAVNRGLQRLRNYPVYVQVNEGLGLQLLVLSKSQNSHMTVMPSYRSEPVNIPQMHALSGRIERFHWLQPDESLIRGMREYQPGDPFKYIAWQASASRGTWMVKQYSASTEAAVCIILNAQMFPDYWSGTRHAVFDELCEIAATYAKELEMRGFQLQFATNAVVPSNPSHAHFGLQSAMSIRAMLGELEPYATRDFLTLWDEYVTAAPAQETALIFTSYEGLQWEAALLAERRKGRNVELVFGPDPLVENESQIEPDQGRGVSV